jgi:hypothetical protein
MCDKWSDKMLKYNWPLVNTLKMIKFKNKVEHFFPLS